jgi:hypothetical protein
MAEDSINYQASFIGNAVQDNLYIFLLILSIIFKCMIHRYDVLIDAIFSSALFFVVFCYVMTNATLF